MITFAISKDLIVKSTYFEHKYTWISLDGKTHNQIDHVLVDRRKHNIMDVRAYIGVEGDTDHQLGKSYASRAGKAKDRDNGNSK